MDKSSASKGAGSRAQPSRANCGTAGSLGQITAASREAISSPRCLRNLDAAEPLAIALPTLSFSSPDCPQGGCSVEQGRPAMGLWPLAIRACLNRLALHHHIATLYTCSGKMWSALSWTQDGCRWAVWG